MLSFAAKGPRQRLWIAGGALVSAVLVLIGYFVLIGPQRSDTASINQRVDATRTANTSLRAHIVSLQTQNEHRSMYEAMARAAQAALPATSGMPAFLRTLQSLGAQTHTDAVNVTVGAPTNVTAVATGTAATAGASATSASASGGSNAVFSLPITAQISGSPAALGQFLQRLQEQQPRAVLITQIIQGSGAAGTPAVADGSNLQLTMQAFVAPAGATLK